jgi:hypothetical protein
MNIKIRLSGTNLYFKFDELMEILENETIYKIMEAIVATIEVEITSEKELTIYKKKEIYKLKNKYIDIEIEADKNVTVYILYGALKPVKEEVLSILEKISEIIK